MPARESDIPDEHASARGSRGIRVGSQPLQKPFDLLVSKFEQDYMDDDPATQILEATYRALCRTGYADLTVRDVAAEADRSTATIHYHYDSKDALITEFLEYRYEQHAARLAAVDGETPREELSALLDEVVSDDDETTAPNLQTAMLEVTAQAPFDDDVRDRLAKFDDALHDALRQTIEAGVERGDFASSVDPAAAADFLVTTAAGVHTRSAAVDQSTERLREAMAHYAETHLVADGSTEVAH